MRIRKTLWMSDSEPIIAIMILFMVLGTINVFSSSFVLATVTFDNPYYFLERHIVWLAVGFVAFIIFRRVDYRKWRVLMPLVLGVTLLSLVAVLFVGTNINGATRWISVGGMSFQPSELAKLVSIMLAAAAFGHANKHGGKTTILCFQFFLILIMAGLVEKEPDMGTASIVCGAPLIMLFMSGGLRKIEFYSLLAVVPVGIISVMMLQPYRIVRLKNTFDPWADAQGAGYQTVQSLSTIGSGGFWGMGLGDGVSKYEYLPEAHTDFAFAIFAQEQGFIGAIFVFLLLAILVLLCIRVANRAADEFGQMLALGIMILVAGQGIANLAMVAGMIPVVGVPLPFISYGGSSLIVTMMAMGILLNISDNGVNPHERDKLERELEEKLADVRVKKARESMRLVR